MEEEEGSGEAKSTSREGPGVAKLVAESKWNTSPYEPVRFAKHLFAKVLCAYGYLHESYLDDVPTFEVLDQAWRAFIKDIDEEKLPHVRYGGSADLEAFLEEGATDAVTVPAHLTHKAPGDLGVFERERVAVVWQMSHSNNTPGMLNKHGEPIFQTCSDAKILICALATKRDGKINLAAYQAAQTRLMKIMPPEKVHNLRAIVKRAFPNWNEPLPKEVVNKELKRRDKFRHGTGGYSAPSMLHNALAAHRESKKAGGSGLITESALLDVPNIDPFKHLDADEGFKDRYTKGVDGLAQLRFDDLIKGFHVCIVDVAAMADIITIAISAIVLKAMKPRATA